MNTQQTNEAKMCRTENTLSTATLTLKRFFMKRILIIRLLSLALTGSFAKNHHTKNCLFSSSRPYTSSATAHTDTHSPRSVADVSECVAEKCIQIEINNSP